MGTLAAGIKEIFATAKTTGSNVMLCGNDGTPDGHMTMANLASVLGEKIRSQGSITDLNSVTDAGVYNIMSVVSNTPISDGLGLLIVKRYSNSYRIIQFFTSDELDKAVYYRKTKNNGATWTAWEQFYDTGLLTNSTQLSTLASALGSNPASKFEQVETNVPHSEGDEVSYSGYGLYILSELIYNKSFLMIFIITNYNIIKVVYADRESTWLSKSSQGNSNFKITYGATSRYSLSRLTVPQ